MKEQRFGRLLVIEFAYVKSSEAYWKCLCDCGNEKIVRRTNLRSGRTKSCGCLYTKHGAAGKTKKLPKLYGAWISMKQRCYNPNCKSYKRYGGRKIRVCDEWSEYIPFRDWALLNGYKEGLSIDRKENDGNYEPYNCQWITQSENVKKAHIDRRRKLKGHNSVVE